MEQEKEKNLSVAQLDLAIKWIESRISEIENLVSQQTISFQEVKEIESNIYESIVSIFGSESIEEGKFRKLDIWEMSKFRAGLFRKADFSHLLAEINSVVVKLRGVLVRLQERREKALLTTNVSIMSATNSMMLSQVSKKAAISRDVFIVHGHDAAAKDAVARVVLSLGLRPVILNEKESEGSLTIIEKLENCSSIEYAIVLLTPDDVGYALIEPDEVRYRARQNVILELGYFLAMLSRERVHVLYKGNIEIPSNFSGVVNTEMDKYGAWKHRVAKELSIVWNDIDLKAL